MYQISRKSRKKLTKAHALLSKVAKVEAANDEARCSIIWINGAKSDLEHINIFS